MKILFSQMLHFFFLTKKNIHYVTRFVVGGLHRIVNAMRKKKCIYVFILLNQLCARKKQILILGVARIEFRLNRLITRIRLCMNIVNLRFSSQFLCDRIINLFEFSSFFFFVNKDLKYL